MTEIVDVDEIPADSTYLFRVRDAETGEEREAILVRLNGTVVSWLNYCRHMTHIELDKGSGAAIRGDEIVCENHGAMFETDTGLCTFGPCEGAYLDGVDVEVVDGVVHLRDADYAYVGPGPIPEEDPTDLSSTSNLEF